MQQKVFSFECLKCFVFRQSLIDSFACLFRPWPNQLWTGWAILHGLSATVQEIPRQEHTITMVLHNSLLLLLPPVHCINSSQVYYWVEMSKLIWVTRDIKWHGPTIWMGTSTRVCLSVQQYHVPSSLITQVKYIIKSSSANWFEFKSGKSFKFVVSLFPGGHSQW